MSIVDQERSHERDQDPDRNLGHDEFDMFAKALSWWNVKIAYEQRTESNGLIRTSNMVFFTRVIDLPNFSEAARIQFQNTAVDLLSDKETPIFYSVLLGYPEHDPSTTQVIVATSDWPTPRMIQDLARMEDLTRRLETGEQAV